MRYLTFGIVAGVLWFGAPVFAKDAAFVESCKDWRGQRFSVDERIAGCTETIAAGIYQGKDLACVYDNRGIDWSNKDDAVRAIADFDQAIKLDPAYAKAYNNRGIARKAKGDLDLAVADYDQAIRLDPGYAVAHFNRALIWDDKGDRDRAMVDYDQAIELNPNYSKAYNNRALVWEAKGDLNRAAVDLDQSIKTSPKNFEPYFSRGRIDFYEGALGKAIFDLGRSSDLNPKDAYSALWLEIVVMRNDLPSRLADAAEQIDMTSWPAPLIRLYLGQLTPDAAMAAANDPDAENRKGQICEANFYIGQAALHRNDKDEAKRLFQLAAAACPNSFLEATSAKAELKMLGVNP